MSIVVHKTYRYDLLNMIDATQISFAPKNGKYASTQLNGRIPKFVMGTEEEPLRAPFGISTPFSGEDSDRLTFDLEVGDSELLDSLHAIDERVVQVAVQNSEQWFGRPLEEATVRAMHTPLLQAAKKDTYKPMVRTKFSTKLTGATTVYVYKSPGVVAKGSRSDITKDSTVRAHVYMNSVYFGNRQFGVSLTCEAVLVYKAADEAQGVSVFGDYMMVDE